MPKVDYVARYRALLPVLDGLNPRTRAAIQSIAEVLRGTRACDPTFACVEDRAAVARFLRAVAVEALDVEPRYWRTISGRAELLAELIHDARIVGAHG